MLAVFVLLAQPFAGSGPAPRPAVVSVEVVEPRRPEATRPEPGPVPLPRVSGDEPRPAAGSEPAPEPAVAAGAVDERHRAEPSEPGGWLAMRSSEPPDPRGGGESRPPRRPARPGLRPPRFDEMEHRAPPPRSPLELPPPRKPPRPALPYGPAGGGSFKFDRTTFHGTIDPDGTVTLEDKPNVRARFDLPCLRCMAVSVQEWAKDPYGYQLELVGPPPFAGTSLYVDDLERVTGGGRERQRDGFRRPIPHEGGPGDDGSGGFPRRMPLGYTGYGQDPSPEDQGVQVVGVSGSFDLTDWVMRSVLGDDPYVVEKLRFLDATREDRAGMRAAETSRRLRASVRRLKRFLEAIWAEPRWSPAEKRRILFQLWDECAEDGAPEVVAATGEVRASIYAFIRRALPEGGPDAYTADEIEALNGERTSRASFAPYAPE